MFFFIIYPHSYVLHPFHRLFFVFFHLFFHSYILFLSLTDKTLKIKNEKVTKRASVNFNVNSLHEMALVARSLISTLNLARHHNLKKATANKKEEEKEFYINNNREIRTIYNQFCRHLQQYHIGCWHLNQFAAHRLNSKLKFLAIQSNLNYHSEPYHSQG